DVTLKMPAFEWVHVQLHQQKGMISLSPPTICNSAGSIISTRIWLALAGQCGDSPVYSPNYQTIHSLYFDLPLVDILKMHFYRNSHL
ncbi:hypothetical protein ACRW7S_10145, partial [Escherichia coli]